MGILVKMAKLSTMLMVALETVEAQNLAKNKPSWAWPSPSGGEIWKCFDGTFNDWTCETDAGIHPHINVDLEAVYHVNFIAVTGSSYNKMKGSELRVGNFTDPTQNPSCGVTVDTAGFFDCD